MSQAAGTVASVLSRADRITAAGITGVVEGHAAGINDRAATFDELVSDLAAGHGPALEAAVTEIRERLPDDETRAQQIMDEAAARYTRRSAPHHGRALQLLVAAGADEDEARRIMDRRGGGWRTPQAEAWKPG